MRGPLETSGLGESGASAGLKRIVLKAAAFEEFKRGLGPGGDIADGSIDDGRSADFA